MMNVTTEKERITRLSDEEFNLLAGMINSDLVAQDGRMQQLRNRGLIAFKGFHFPSLAPRYEVTTLGESSWYWEDKLKNGMSRHEAIAHGLMTADQAEYIPDAPVFLTERVWRSFVEVIDEHGGESVPVVPSA